MWDRKSVDFARFEHEPLSLCFRIIFCRSNFIFSMCFLASSHEILLHVMKSYNYLWHSFMTSSLSVLISPRLLSVSLTQTFTFRFLIKILRALFFIFRQILFFCCVFFKKGINFIPNIPTKFINCRILSRGHKMILRQKFFFLINKRYSF